MLFLLCLFFFFWRLGVPPLFDLDEALYVSCARQMVLSGDMVTPRLNSRPPGRPNELTSPFYEKPIMVYWAPAISMKIFGISELASRLPSALAALLTTFIIYIVGRRWLSRSAGLFAAVVYAASPMTIADARQMTTDGLLTLWFSIAMFSFWEINRRSQSSQPRNSLFPAVLFWISCGLAMLTKGVVGILLPVMVIVSYALVSRKLIPEHPLDWPKIVLRLKIPMGILILTAIVVPWHLLIWRAGGHDAQGRTFVQEYFIRQHIGRFRGLDTVHNAPIFTFFAYFLIGFFPWSCFTPAAFRSRHYPYLQDENSENRRMFHFFLLIWFWTIFIFFSLGAAKLPTYIVPAYPAAALMVGRWAELLLITQNDESAFKEYRRLTQRGAFWALFISLILGLAVFLAPRFTPANSPIPRSIFISAEAMVGCISVFSSIAWIITIRGKVLHLRISAAITLIMMLTVTAIGCTTGYAIAKSEILGPYQRLAARASEDATRGIPVIYYHIIPRRPSMLFYADYSPFERKDVPLLPSIPTDSKECDVITSRPVYNEILLPELSKQSEWEVKALTMDGDPEKGWLLIRLSRNAAHIK